MGQKINPIGLRTGVFKDWNSRWFAANSRNYSKLLAEDLAIKEHIKTKYAHAAITRVEIERFGNRLRVSIHSGRPGILIGFKGKTVTVIKEHIEKISQNKEVLISIKEVHHPETDAQLVAENIAMQIVRRVPHRRAMKRAVQLAVEQGVKGIKVMCSGRLAGAEMASREWYRNGRVPLQTLRANIDYGVAQAITTYGCVGVKCWIYKGDFQEKKLHRPELEGEEF